MMIDLKQLKKEWATAAFSYTNSYREIDQLLATDRITATWLVAMLDNNLEQMKSFYIESEQAIDLLTHNIQLLSLQHNMLMEMIESVASENEVLMKKIIGYDPGKNTKEKEEE